jgi:hypothetical protein
MNLTLNSLASFSTVAQTPAASTRTYVAGSKNGGIAASLNVGTLLRWTLYVTKTAAGTAASTYDICFGMNGTTADVARCSFTKPAGTAVVDTAKIVIECFIRGPISASGVAVGTFGLTHNLTSTGHATVPAVTLVTVSNAFNMASTHLFAGLCVTPGASDALTIQQVFVEVWSL